MTGILKEFNLISLGTGHVLINVYNEYNRVFRVVILIRKG